MDLSEMEEQRCPDCHRPLMIVPVDQKQNTYVIHCACNRLEFIIPDGAMARLHMEACEEIQNFEKAGGKKRRS